MTHQSIKHVVILGSTGSIGENALRVVAAHPDRLRVVGLAARTNAPRLLEQAREFGVTHVAITDPAVDSAWGASEGLIVHRGLEGMVHLAGMDGVDVVLCAVVGLVGLEPVLAALDRGTDVALATKEVLVAGGELLARRCLEAGAHVLPVDSEHSGVFQALCESSDEAPPFAPGALQGVRRIILTASGGPFHDQHDVDFEAVTAADALQHPTWRMGPKITVDSATLMNKGLELIEAHWLFGVPLDAVDTVIHPQSIVHALVEFDDGNVVAHLGVPDMRLAIQYALTWPARVGGGLPRLDLTRTPALSFGAADTDRFPCLGLARQAAAAGGTMPAVLNAANEVAVQRFLAGEIPFAGIARLIAAAMAEHQALHTPDLRAILEADLWARDRVSKGAPEAH